LKANHPIKDNKIVSGFGQTKQDVLYKNDLS